MAKIKRLYGLTPQTYLDLLHQQEGRCAICRQLPDRGLQVDHCHDTGRVRGLLCGPCNRALGLLQEDPHVIARAAVFVAQNQET